MKKLAFVAAPLAAALFAATPALAHPGHGFGFDAGVLHPLTGADHMAAMLAVGLWSGVALKRSWVGAAVFMAGLTLGALSGLSVATEPLVMLSLVALGAMLVSARRASPLALAAIGAFAFAHGMAHGAEGSGSTYVLGMLAGSALLHGLGIGLARVTSFRIQRALGFGIGALGLAMMVG